MVSKGVIFYPEMSRLLADPYLGAEPPAICLNNGYPNADPGEPLPGLRGSAISPVGTDPNISTLSRRGLMTAIKHKFDRNSL
jgi:hypothetical protein